MLLRRHEVGLEDGAIVVTLIWSEITGGYNTPNTMVEIGA